MEIGEESISWAVSSLLGAEITAVLLVDGAIARRVVGSVGSNHSGTDAVAAAEKEPAPTAKPGGVTALFSDSSGKAAGGKKGYSSWLVDSWVLVGVVGKVGTEAVFRPEELGGAEASGAVFHVCVVFHKSMNVTFSPTQEIA